MTGKPLVEYALSYAAGGFPVLPLHSPNGAGCDCHRPDCGSPAKHPRTAHGLTDASTDEATIRRWWEMWPEANVGIRLPDQYVVVDVDTEEVTSALDGRELPTTATAKTGRGWQFLYHTDQPVPPAVGVVEHVDLRGPGSYVVAPPSRHVNGATYVWVAGPKDGIADAPEWIYEIGAVTQTGPPADPDQPIPEGGRNAALTRLGGAMRRQGASLDTVAAALLAENAGRCRPPLPESEVRTIARSVSRYAPEPDVLIRITPAEARVSRIVQLSDVRPERVDWLWRSRIPLGKVTILDGDPGFGKSTISLELGARVTRGLPMPDETTRREPAGVVLMSAEDGLADTIRPRLDAAGADVSRVVALTAVSTAGGVDRLPTLPADLDRLEATVLAAHAEFVVIDVLMAYLDAAVNAHRDQDVRGALAPLAVMAERTGAAVLVLRHLNKSTGGPAVYRGGGSIGIVGAARSALVVGQDPEDESRLVLAVTKSNLAPLAPSIAYRIVDHGGAGMIAWEGVTSLTAAQLLAAPTSSEERTALDEAKAVLRDILGAGPVPSKDVQRQAREAGVSDATLRRAKDALGVRSIRPDGFTGPWSWELPGVHAQETPYLLTLEDEHVRAEMSMYGDDAESLEPAPDVEEAASTTAPGNGFDERFAAQQAAAWESLAKDHEP